MKPRPRGFTLIEMMIVIAIIALLMAMTIPEIGGIMRSVRVQGARGRVMSIHRSVEDYSRQYGIAPPDSGHKNPMPGNQGDDDNEWLPTHEGAYPPFILASSVYDDIGGGRHHYLHNDPYASGGRYLVYYLMGPSMNGWHRPRTRDLDDPNYAMRSISAEWDAPEALADYISDGPLKFGEDSCQFPLFLDGIGVSGECGGRINYIRRHSNGNWHVGYKGPINEAFIGDIGWSGKSNPHQQKIVDQCEGKFAIISPGGDQKFGYYRYFTNDSDKKGYWQDPDKGFTDDIANFPLK